MTNKKLALYGFLHALGTVLYIALLALVMTKTEHGYDNRVSPVIMGITVLSLFVLSASITGSLVVGRPILWYLNGQKAEAIKLFLYTIGWLFVFILLTFTIITITF